MSERPTSRLSVVPLALCGLVGCTSPADDERGRSLASEVAEPSELSEVAERRKLREELRSLGMRVCEEGEVGTTWKENCNICRCNPGQVRSCTKRGCSKDACGRAHTTLTRGTPPRGYEDLDARIQELQVDATANGSWLNLPASEIRLKTRFVGSTYEIEAVPGPAPCGMLVHVPLDTELETADGRIHYRDEIVWRLFMNSADLDRPGRPERRVFVANIEVPMAAASWFEPEIAKTWPELETDERTKLELEIANLGETVHGSLHHQTYESDGNRGRYEHVLLLQW